MSDWSSPFCLYTKSRQSLYTRSAIRLRDEYDASSAQVADARLFFVVLQSQDVVVVAVAGDMHQMPLLNSGSGPDMRRLECVLRTRRTWRVITQAQSQREVALELGWLLCVPSTLYSSVCVSVFLCVCVCVGASHLRHSLLRLVPLWLGALDTILNCGVSRHWLELSAALVEFIYKSKKITIKLQ